ncbi:hypothetical protein CLOM_g6097 [Closterium sp. NIES-68]|nr:hypothetical protein CLOM_g6097 [Closterium sp. NIES-68]GJP84449.1 hypothetical protein CLOP_g14504 [Closterium sp. NIES-67]
MAIAEYHPHISRRPISITTFALSAHAISACLVLLLLYCSPTTALKPISRPLISRLSDARHGRVSARTAAAARRAEKTSAAKAAAEEASAQRAAEAASVGGTIRRVDSMSTGLGLSGSSSASAQTSVANMAALTAIFTAAQLPIPPNKPNACTWPGVTCAVDGAVIGLNLTSSVSRLLLPRTPRLCNSTARERGGKFPPTLSASIGQLTDLIDLRAANLWLAGSVPQSLSRLTKLQSLDLQDNCFAGPLPFAFFRLPYLFTLRTSRNFFSGGLPQRPVAYATMTSLAVLDLGINLLSGPIPAALATLPMLWVLLLNSNGFSGEIPPALLGKQMSALVLDQNRLSGDLSGQQIKASFIGFSGNRLAGNFNQIRFSESVSFIDVSDNLFSGTFPQLLCSSSGSLESADFSRNRLTGAVPANCFKPANRVLLALFLSRNNFSGSLQPFSSLPKSIVAVDLAFNKFTGIIPQGLTTLPQLNNLNLGANSLTGPIPPFCQGQQALVSLNLASNALSGPPTPLASPTCAPSLDALYLSSNRLSGSIPATISSFKSLKWLLLDRNALTGAIPAGVSGMQQLKGLRVSYNRLSGPIPTVWPRTIGQVLLAGNQLSGAVPAALSKLKRASFKPGNPNLCGTPLPACS